MYRSVDLCYSGDVPYIDIYTNMLIATVPNFKELARLVEKDYDLEMQNAESSQSIDIKDKYSNQLNEMISQNQQHDARAMLMCHLIMNDDLNHIIVKKAEHNLFQISPKNANNNTVKINELKHKDMLFSEFDALQILKEVEYRRLSIIYREEPNPSYPINMYPGYDEGKRYETRLSDLFFESTLSNTVQLKNDSKFRPS